MSAEVILALIFCLPCLLAIVVVIHDAPIFARMRREDAEDHRAEIRAITDAALVRWGQDDASRRERGEIL